LKWVLEAVAALFPDAPESADSEWPEEARAAFARKLSEALGNVGEESELRDILDAGTIVLHHAALGGQLDFATFDRAASLLSAVSSARPVSVIGLGNLPREVLKRLGPGIAGRFLLDVESSQPLQVEDDVVRILLDTQSGGDLAYSLGEMLRSSYRQSSGSRGLPDLLADSLLPPAGTRVAVHVVVSIEDPWIMLLQDILFDLRAFLDQGKKGRVLLHLLTRPSPRLRGIYRAAAEEIAAGRLFDDAFVIAAAEVDQVRRSADFIRLSARIPELLMPRLEAKARGSLSSYGIASAPVAEGRIGAFVSALEDAYKRAAPSWVPVNAVLSECVSEQVVYVHPPDKPPFEESWKVCPQLMQTPVAGADPTLCRIQRGLKLEDLKLM
jgi:hypothetical protein